MARRMTLSRSAVFKSSTAPSTSVVSKSPLSMSSSTTWSAPQANQATGMRSYQQQQHVGSYKALANAVMKRRISRILALAAISIFMLLHISSADSIHVLIVGLVSPVRLLSLFLTSGIIWIGGVAPILVLKRLELSKPKMYEKTRIERIKKQIFSMYAIQVGMISLMSGMSVWIGYCLSVIWLQHEASLGPFVKITGRQSLQYNERPFYLAFLQIGVIVATTLDYLVNDYGRPHSLASPNCSKIGARLRLRLSIRVPRAFHRLIISITLTCVTYVSLRLFILPAFITSPWSAFVVRPRMVAILRHNAALSFGLSVRALIQGTIWTLMWEVVNAMWDIYQSHPWQVAQFGKDPNRALIDGLSNDKTRHMALLELTDIATFEKSGRETIFSDVRSSPRSFNIIARECLKVIGTTYRSAQHRGKLPMSSTRDSKAPPSPPMTFMSALSTTSSTRVDSTQQQWKASTSIKHHENVFRPQPQQKVLPRILGYVTSSLSTPSNDLAKPITSPPPVSQQLTSAPIPEILRYPNTKSQQSVGVITLQSPSPAVPSSSTSIPTSSTTWTSLVVKCVPDAIKMSKEWKWLHEEEYNGQVETCIPEWKSCVLAVDALTRLLAVSFDEDTYGVAQSDIPRSLEALVILLEELETLELFWSQSVQEQSQQVQNQMKEAIWECIRPLQSALISGLSVVLSTFEASLHEIKFPPKIAKRLQELVES